MNAKYWTLIAAAAGLTLLTACGRENTAEANGSGQPVADTPAGQGSAERVASEAPAKDSGFHLPWTKPKVTLAQGTTIKVRTIQSISTESVAPGGRFSAELAEPLVVDGKTVAKRGATVEGVVVDADKGGRVKGVASLALRLTSLHAGGDEIAIQTSTVAKTARATKKKDAAKVGIGAGIGAAIGAIAGGGKGAAIGAASGAGAGTGVVLATRGEPAVIGAESLLTFRLTAPVTVELGS